MKYKNNVLASQKLFKSELGADIQFIMVNNEKTKVPAHKAILAVASPVFEQMFYGDLKDGDEIVLYDVSLEAFVEFLQLFYLDQIEITKENMYEVCKMVDKYDVKDSRAVIENILQQTSTTESIFHYYDMMVTFNFSKETIERFEREIIAEHLQCFQTESFKKIGKCSLMKILQSTFLQCPETDIFEATITWATETCKNENWSLNSQNLKAALGECFTLIRFPLMTSIELLSCSDKYPGLLENKEFEDILQYINIKTPLTCAKYFSVEPRLASEIDLGCWNEGEPLDHPDYDSDSQMAHIAINKIEGSDVWLTYFDIVLSTEPDIQDLFSSVKDIEMNDKKLRARRPIVLKNEKKSKKYKQYRIFLEEPFLCEANKKYYFAVGLYELQRSKKTWGMYCIPEFEEKTVSGITFSTGNFNGFITKLHFERKL